MTNTQQRIGAVLAGLAEQQGLSVRELARRSSVPESTLRFGLHGSRPLKVDDFLAVCDALDVPASEVVARAEASAA